MISQILDGQLLSVVRANLNTLIGEHNDREASLAGIFSVPARSDLVAITPSELSVGDVVVSQEDGARYLRVANSATGDHLLDYTATGGVKLESVPFRRNPDVHGNDSIPFIDISPVAVTPPNNHMFIQQRSSVRDDATTVQIQRIVDSDDGHINPKALRVYTSVDVDTMQTEWAISGELYSYSNLTSAGNTAVSGVAHKYGTASVFGGHFQSKDHNKYADAASVTSIVGMEVNIKAVGLDRPSSGPNYGGRICMDVVAKTNDEVAGWDTAVGNFGDGEIGIGIQVRADTSTDGYFRVGILVTDADGNPNSIGTGIRVNTDGLYNFYAGGSPSEAHFMSNGNPNIGAIFAGNYGSGSAIRIGTGSYIAVETTNAIRTAYGVSSLIWGFYNNTNERVGFNMSADPHIRLGGTQVLRRRITGWGAPTGAADRSTFDTTSVTVEQLAERVKGLLDDLTTHGLIGA